MATLHRFLISWRGFLILFLVVGLGPVADVRGDNVKVDFARDIHPIFAQHCVRCHGPKKQEGGLRLDLRRRATQGGDTGPVLVTGASQKSVLIQRITAKDLEKRMPPSGEPLGGEQIKTLDAWIDQGAGWPDEWAGQEASSDHWAFRPIKRPRVPAVDDPGRIRNAIDHFVLARLEERQRAFGPEAERRVLVRRLYLDLVGLPPSFGEVEAFVRSTHPDAYADLVDRLLDSKHFGERWGRHWLDLARFAESDGYENDGIRGSAWRFRDWVIDAVNRDVPFDQFTIEQLAGDLLPQATAEQKIATGFHRNTLYNSASSADKEEFRIKAVKDRTDTTGGVWMGLTLGCAQCHSHKYDPLTHREYYQLFAFFNNTDNQDISVSGGQANGLRAVVRSSHVHKRGNFQELGSLVAPMTPAFLPALEPRGKEPDRLDLARWLVRPDHPLTARVAANHLWQHLFGQGLVATPENFGSNGRPPSHPELLDWLAAELIRLKWSRKALIRTIVLSTTYRQSSTYRDPLAATDPENALLNRQNRFRVEAEIVRDLALSASGLIDLKIGGPSIVPPFPDGLLDQKVTQEALKMPTPDRHRRGVYIHVQRTLTHPMLAPFDVTDGNQTCARRDRSTNPLQALTMLNDPVFIEAARALGNRLRRSFSQSEDRLRLGVRTCLSRNPTDQELSVLMELVQTQQRLGASEAAVWTGVARTLFNLDEFITRE